MQRGKVANVFEGAVDNLVLPLGGDGGGADGISVAEYINGQVCTPGPNVSALAALAVVGVKAATSLYNVGRLAVA